MARPARQRLRRRTWACVACVLACIAVYGGCQSTRLPGEKFYLRGHGVGTAYLPRDARDVYDASVAVVGQELGYTVLREAFEGGQGIVEARTASDRRLKIETYSQGDNETRLEIRMDFDTPDLVVRNIMSKIEARLR